MKDLKGRIEITLVREAYYQGDEYPCLLGSGHPLGGRRFEEVLRKYPNLEKGDVRAAIKFASLVLGNEEDNLYGT